MNIKWLGHSCFMITSEVGIKIITDPYVTGGNIKYSEITESADIVTVSHDHFDHNNVASVGGKPGVVRETVKVRGIEFTGVPSYHDEAKGQQRGKNTIFCFEVDGIRVCHLGDLGHQLGDKQIAELGRIDILLIPVGGCYTIEAKVATQLCNQLKPKVIIPMHYKTDRYVGPIAGIDDFLKGKERIARLEASERDFKLAELPTTTQIIVLKPEL